MHNPFPSGSPAQHQNIGARYSRSEDQEQAEAQPCNAAESHQWPNNQLQWESASIGLHGEQPHSSAASDASPRCARSTNFSKHFALACPDSCLGLKH
jgi:hypothetical protein